MEQLLPIAICLLGGLLMTRIMKKVNLPAVTGYLIYGVLLGPFVIGRLNWAGVGFATDAQVAGFDILSNVALGFIAFTMGNEFRLKAVREMGKQAITVGIFQAVVTTALVDLVLVLLHWFFPNLISVPAALTLGAIAAATAPAATLMVVRQYKADGPMTKLLLMVVAIDDAVGLILFSLSFGIASSLTSGVVNLTTILVEPILEIVLSLVLGGAMGWLLHHMEKFFHSRSKRLSVSIGFVALTVALSSLEFTIGSVHMGFSLLLTCMMLGTVFCNICESSEELMDRTERWTAPLYVVFFVLSGAGLDLSIMTKPTALILGTVFVVVRSIGKYYGAYISTAMTNCTKAVQKNLGITLLPQAGVALGMAITAKTLPGDGDLIRNIVLFSVLVFELFGPALTKRALTDAGEIHPEGKTSARVLNPEAPEVLHAKKKSKGSC